ncbi:hypothetical protein [Halorhodospira halochloris]|uniref:hypothetical protein n=1 Tax=Halorhodospira halochloris TaxID=1052 RepID=UPI0013A585E7|nr:hypothetical protein [Halorhodospira halochloris]
MNPSLEASWRHPWRQDLHTGADEWRRRSFRGTLQGRIYGVLHSGAVKWPRDSPLL